MRSIRVLRLVMLAAVVLLHTACSSLGALRDPPRVSIVNLAPLSMSLLEQRFRVTLRVQNPSGNALSINGMDYEIALNGKRFATGVSNQGFNVPGFGENTIDVDVSSNILRVFEQLLTLERDGSNVFDYAISGGLSLDNTFGKIPFTYEDSLDLSGIAKALKQSGKLI